MALATALAPGGVPAGASEVGGFCPDAVEMERRAKIPAKYFRRIKIDGIDNSRFTKSFERIVECPYYCNFVTGARLA